jgi:integrase
MAVLQGLCGLRVWEACYLRKADINLREGVVIITKTPLHEPKNRNSYRTIPIPGEAVQAIEETIQNAKVCSLSEVFLSKTGLTWNRNSLASAWRRALEQARVELGNPRLLEIPPKKLRAFFGTTASRLGAPDRILKSYMGQAPGDILGEHYRAVDLSELKAVSGRMEGWRSLISGNESGNSLETDSWKKAVSI